MDFIKLRKFIFSNPIYVLFPILLCLRVIYAYDLPIDSDEPQHLHVIWGWANGLMQYRDVFDNHAPLFHILYSPIYALFGERPDILILMRLTIIPLFFVSLWAVYLIGKALYSRQAGVWAVIFTSLYPAFFMVSVEFRTDDLWVALWLLTVAAAVQKPLTPLKLFFAGILLGATFSVSMKTFLLLSAFLLAFIISTIFIREIKNMSVRQYFLNSSLVMSGALVIPLILVLYFGSQKALGPLYYGVIQHNIVPGLGGWKPLDSLQIIKRLAIIVAVTMSIFLLQSNWIKPREHGLQKWRMMIILTWGFGLFGLYEFWPLVTRQDFLPLTPLFIIFITGSALEFTHRKQITGKWPIRPQSILLVLALLELSTFMTRSLFWHPQLLPETKLLAEVLQLTSPKDTIVDLKGESVFRERSFYYVLEGVTRKRIQLGLIKDDIAEDVIHSKTTVAALDSPFFPSQGREFLNENFLPVGSLRVAGQMLKTEKNEASSNIEFDVRIPTDYALLAEHGITHGWLDNIPYDGPRQLDAGRHFFRLANNNHARLALIWAPAIERGFSPFNLSQK